MPYRAPVSDYRFLMENVVGFAQVTATARFAEATPDMADAILTEAAKMCEEVLDPLNRSGDLHPAHLENGVVRTRPGFADGYKAIAEGGWIGMSASPEVGGMGLPMTLTTAVNEMMASACLSLQLNPLMTQGQIEALEHHASDDAQGHLSAQTDCGRVVRHDEPDRTAGRIGRGRAARQGRAERRRHLCDHGPERFTSAGATMISPKTSATLCWRACPTGCRAPRGSACLWCRN